MTTTGPNAGRCPDGGHCHHDCAESACFRVRNCGPLSGVFPSNEWPAEVVVANTATPRCDTNPAPTIDAEQ